MTLPIRRRLKRPPEFKAMLVAQYQEPGASIAAVAMEHQINCGTVQRAVTGLAAMIQPE